MEAGVESLATASRYELGGIGANLNLYPVYLRGLAYLRLKEGPPLPLSSRKSSTTQARGEQSDRRARASWTRSRIRDGWRQRQSSRRLPRLSRPLERRRPRRPRPEAGQTEYAKLK